MVYRAPLLITPVLCALLALSARAGADSPAPVIRSISPMQVKVGESLTVRGSGFLPGNGKTRVFFARRGGGTAIARAGSSTRTRLVVTVPAQLEKVLAGKPARIQIRVLGGKFGKASAAHRSPVVSPAATGTPGDDGGAPAARRLFRP